MTLILGLDIATRTGYAYYDDQAPLSAIRVGHIQCEGEEFEEKAAFLGRSLVKLIKEDKPDFILIERPIRAQPNGGGKRTMKFMGEEQVVEAKGSGINAVISSNQLVGAASAIIGAYRIPFDTIASVSWRKAFLGFGTHKGWERKDWKKAARDRCTALKIKVTNDDQGEAVGIAFAGSGLDRVKMMKIGQAA